MVVLRSNGIIANTGDGAAIENETELDIKSYADTEFLMFHFL